MGNMTQWLLLPLMPAGLLLPVLRAQAPLLPLTGLKYSSGTNLPVPGDSLWWVMQVKIKSAKGNAFVSLQILPEMLMQHYGVSTWTS